MLPLNIEEFTPAWFSEIFSQEVKEAVLVSKSEGTTARAIFKLTGDPRLPKSVFVKYPPVDLEQRQFVNMLGMGTSEAQFYQELAKEIPVRVPKAYYANHEDNERYILVLEDLTAEGAHFPTPNDPEIATYLQQIVENLAKLHAKYWNSNRFQPNADLAWLAPRIGMSPDGGAPLIAAGFEKLKSQINGSFFQKMTENYLRNATEIVKLWNQGVKTLGHGDPHLWNLFVDVKNDNSLGFLDWGVINHTPGMRDVAYALSISTPSDLRQAKERDWIKLYCQGLAKAGVTFNENEAWEQYKLFSIFAWVAAVCTAAMGPKWHPIEISMGAVKRTTIACEQLDCLGFLESNFS